jgi:hypothetical protein
MRLREVDRKIAAAGNKDTHLPCLVRKTPGPDLTVYHSKDAPCGRVRDKRNFRVMKESDAKDASPWVWLYRCSACNWHRAGEIHGRRLLGNS